MSRSIPNIMSTFSETENSVKDESIKEVFSDKVDPTILKIMSKDISKPLFSTENFLKIKEEFKDHQPPIDDETFARYTDSLYSNVLTID